MSTFANYARKSTIPTDQMVEATFMDIREYVDKETGETRCFFVTTKEYKDVQVPFFGCDQNNFEFENLQDELGITPEESGNLAAYKAKRGTKIKVTGIARGQYVNAHFGTDPVPTTDNFA